MKGMAVTDNAVVVVGAGPVGLAAAAALLERGLEPLVLERGTHAGAAVAQWRHVRLFSPWSELIAPAARRLLAACGWREPAADAYPTGGDWVDAYVQPLAEALGERVRFDAEVTGVARQGRDRMVDAGRAELPLMVHVRSRDGVEERIAAAAVIDASGTWGSPNPLGADGLLALGEAAAAERITYQMPDLDDPDVRQQYAGRHVAVVGSGHSALTALVALVGLAQDEASTRISWVLRRGAVDRVFGGGDDDQLPARGALGRRAQQAASDGRVRIVRGFRTAAVERDRNGKVVLVSVDGQHVDAVDQIIALTGFRPDLSWLSEIRLDLDPALQAPVALAPLIDPNVHSCGTVPPHGVTELAHPEPRLYLAGIKSYGRAPTFLALTGYEQVRSIAADLAGDRAAAERVELTLPETGVCGGGGLSDEPAACSPPSTRLATT
jgi:thioredoxin reductase